MKFKHKKEIEEKLINFDINSSVCQRIMDDKDIIVSIDNNYPVRGEGGLYLCGCYLYYYSLLISKITLDTPKAFLVDGPLNYRYISAEDLRPYPSLDIEIRYPKNSSMHIDYIYYNKPYEVEA